MPRDRPWKIDWPGGKIVVHASSPEEATRKVLEYLKATNPFRVEAIQEEYAEKEIRSTGA
jgi:hypothetical protein